MLLKINQLLTPFFFFFSQNGEETNTMMNTNMRRTVSVIKAERMIWRMTMILTVAVAAIDIERGRTTTLTVIVIVIVKETAIEIRNVIGNVTGNVIRTVITRDADVQDGTMMRNMILGRRIQIITTTTITSENTGTEIAKLR